MEWQPIETAPKDGTFVRLRFGEIESDESGPFIARNQGDGLGWWDEDGLDFNYGQDEPTHWMPIGPAIAPGKDVR